MILVVRTTGEPDRMFHALQSAAAALDPTISVFDLTTQHVSVSLYRQRMAATLLSAFGLLALQEEDLTHGSL